jgi:hypothetical protein
MQEINEMMYYRGLGAELKRANKEFYDGLLSCVTGGVTRFPNENLCKDIQCILEGYGLYTIRQGEVLTIDTEIDKVVLGDVFGDPIVSIEEIDWPDKVYDFTVEGFKTFNGLDGIVHYDTFHLAGVGSQQVTTGVPRIDELIDDRENISNPIMKLYVTKDETDEAYITHIAETLK